MSSMYKSLDFGKKNGMCIIVHFRNRWLPSSKVMQKDKERKQTIKHLGFSPQNRVEDKAKTVYTYGIVVQIVVKNHFLKLLRDLSEQTHRKFANGHSTTNRSSRSNSSHKNRKEGEEEWANFFLCLFLRFIVRIFISSVFPMFKCRLVPMSWNIGYLNLEKLVYVDFLYELCNKNVFINCQ